MSKELVKPKPTLPARVEDLKNFVYIRQVKLASYREAVKRLRNGKAIKEEYEPLVIEANELVREVAFGKVAIGEWSAGLEKAKGGRGQTSSAKRTSLKEAGFNPPTAWKYEKLAAHQEVIDEAIANANQSCEVCPESRFFSLIPKPSNPAPIIPQGKYNVIYADPPWPVGQIIMDKWEAPLEEYKYLTLTLEKIEALKVGGLAADDCSLFLWTTHTFLHEAFHVMECWGFKYHVCITWDKGSGWTQNGFHRRTEFCLYGYTGKMNIKQDGEAIPTLITEKAKGHSIKPDIMYGLIEMKFQEPRIELFARGVRDGWDAWGNEA